MLLYGARAHPLHPHYNIDRMFRLYVVAVCARPFGLFESTRIKSTQIGFVRFTARWIHCIRICDSDQMHMPASEAIQLHSSCMPSRYKRKIVLGNRMCASCAYLVFSYAAQLFSMKPCNDMLQCNQCDWYGREFDSFAKTIFKYSTVTLRIKSVSVAIIIITVGHI